MYVRRPDKDPSPIRIPENYSGHAFREPRPYSDMPPPTRLDTPPQERRTETMQLPPVIDIEEADDREEDFSEPTFYPVEEKEPEPIQNAERDSARPSLFSALLPSGIASANHFPFGHGLGSEELLILAVMLLVYLSGEEQGKTDTEFLLMLGLLLFAG